MTGELGSYLERHHQDTIRRVANPGTEWLDPATVDELVTWGFLRARTAADRLPPGGRAYGYVLTDLGRQYAIANGLAHADTPWTSVAPAERKPDPVWDRIAAMPSEELRERVAQAAAEAQATLDEHAHVFDDTVSAEAMHRPAGDTECRSVALADLKRIDGLVATVSADERLCDSEDFAAWERIRAALDPFPAGRPTADDVPGRLRRLADAVAGGKIPTGLERLLPETMRAAAEAMEQESVSLDLDEAVALVGVLETYLHQCRFGRKAGMTTMGLLQAANISMKVKRQVEAMEEKPVAEGGE